MSITWSQEEVANTIRRYQPKMVDQILNHSPFLYMLKEKGNTNLVSGGTTLGHEIHLKENPTGKFYFGDEQFDTSREAVMRNVDYDWKQYAITVTLTGREKRINMGVNLKHRLLKNKILNAQNTMANDIALSIFSDGTGTSGKEIGGLQLLVADDPTTGVVGTVDRATYSIWRNQIYDFSVEGVTPGSDTIKPAMDDLWLRCTFNNETPNLIIAGSTYFRYYETYLDNIKRINVNATSMAKSLGDAGFTVLEYKNVPVVYDSNCNAERLYMLNMNHMYWEVHPEANFALDEERISFNQDSKLFPIIFMGNLSMSKSKTQGVMHA